MSWSVEKQFTGVCSSASDADGWVKEGDRCHKQLIRLDSLVLTYPGWEEDVQEAEAAHTGMKTFVKFDQKFWEIEEKQRMFDGDRSHSRLKKLDSFTFTYDGWDKDILIAEEQHVTNRTYNFKRKLEGMTRRQKMFEDDRSHPHLVELDSLDFTYPGFEADVIAAEEAHTGLTFQNFEDKIIEMKLRQQLHYGDRSHPRVVALDSLYLSYPKYEEDVEYSLELHFCNRSFNFKAKMDGMEKKQKMHIGDRSHPNLMLLDSLRQNLNYPSWEQDIHEALLAHTGSAWTKFDDIMFRMQERQRIHKGDRSHPRLVALDSLKLSYPSWKDDVKFAERDHVHSWKASFEKKLAGMKEKQCIYSGYSFSKDIPRKPISIGECIVCSQNPKSFIFVPCGHLCLCSSCASRDGFKHCPICRQPVERLLKPISTENVSSVYVGNCVMCSKNENTHILAPCGHLCLCSDCIPTEKKCPVCKLAFTHRVKLFF